MLKNLTSFVLASNQSSTYSRRYASGLFSSVALLEELFEHPQLFGLEKLFVVDIL